MKAKRSAWTPRKALISREHNPAMIARLYIVRGRVQGVGYRWFVDHEARQLGLAGWVRNNMDGSVEVLAMGSAEQHAAMRGKLQQGPRASRVDHVEESAADAVAGITTF